MNVFIVEMKFNQLKDFWGEFEVSGIVFKYCVNFVFLLVEIGILWRYGII